MTTFSQYRLLTLVAHHRNATHPLSTHSNFGNIPRYFYFEKMIKRMSYLRNLFELAIELYLYCNRMNDTE